MEIDLSEFTNRPPTKCSVGKFADALAEGDQANLDAALQEQTITTASIHRWMETRGAKFRYNLVATHRRGECPCPRI